MSKEWRRQAEKVRIASIEIGFQTKNIRLRGLCHCHTTLQQTHTDIMLGIDPDRTRQQDVDLGAQRGHDQTVENGVVGRGVGAEQELALGAATGDQVELARKHLSGEHAVARNQDLGRSIATRSRAVGVARVRWPAIVSEIRTR